MELNKDNLAPCNHKEANPRKCVYAKHTSVTGSRNILVSTEYTDVVVLVIALFADLNIDVLWLAFGKGKAFCWIPIHDISKSIAPH